MSPQLIHKRHAARKLAMQAIYSWSINPIDINDLLRHFKEDPDYSRVDKDYFSDLIRQVIHGVVEIDARIASKTDIPVDQIDTVELSVLRVAIYELRDKIETPYKVVISEAIALAKKFGSVDGHKYVNAVLDKLSPELRQLELTANSK